MSGWAGFWMGCGLVIIGVAIAHVGDSIQKAAQILGQVYQNTYTDEEDDDVQS